MQPPGARGVKVLTTWVAGAVFYSITEAVSVPDVRRNNSPVNTKQSA